MALLDLVGHWCTSAGRIRRRRLQVALLHPVSHWCTSADRVKHWCFQAAVRDLMRQMEEACVLAEKP